MIYWLSGSLVILVLVTVLLTPESNESSKPGTVASVISEETVTADATSSSVQPTYSAPEESPTEGGDQTTNNGTKNVGAIVKPEFASNDISENQGERNKNWRN